MTLLSGNRRSAQPEGAPGDLGIVEAFLNTANRQKRVELLRSPRALADWLAGVGLLPLGDELTADDLEHVVKVRESLRLVLAARHGGFLPAEVVDLLDHFAHETHLRVRFGGDGTPRLEPAVGGLDAALGQLFGFITMAHAEGRWLRFKVCADPDCQSAFYDRSSNHAAKWCTPRCGSRVQARAQRRRRRSY